MRLQRDAILLFLKTTKNLDNTLRAQSISYAVRGDGVYMSNELDHYQILGVDRNATQEEIQKAWRYKAILLHPDRMKGFPEAHRQHAENDIKYINIAYEILRDPERRIKYDNELDDKNRSRNREKTVGQNDVRSEPHVNRQETDTTQNGPKSDSSSGENTVGIRSDSSEQLYEINSLSQMPLIWQAIHTLISLGGFYAIILGIERIWHKEPVNFGLILLFFFWILFYASVISILAKNGINLGFHKR